VSAHPGDLLNRLAQTRLARQAAEVLFRARSRARLASFDRQSPARAQARTLLGLLHQARGTRFGRAHDFGRIRTPADFRRLVPLRTPAEFWRAHWQPAYPHLDGLTWPGPLPHLAVPPPGDDRLHALPLSRALQSAHSEALRTALGLVVHARPQAHLLAGTLLWLGDDTTWTTPAGAPVEPRTAAAERFPALLRPYLRVGQAESARALAEELAGERVTCLVGPAERVVALAEAFRELRGAGPLRRVWPHLTAVLYTRRSAAPPLARLRNAAGEGVLLLEALTRPEGPVAVEDPRHGGLRLLTDHGVHFEFVPAGAANEPQPARLGVGEVEPGAPYELALTSPAGLWACRTGLTVSFERLSPPVLRVLRWAPAAAPAPVRADAPAPLPAPAPHPQNAGIPAALPRSFSHSPWSAPADRG
jgi:hypothetical protein